MRCANCNAVYDDDLDGCPECAEAIADYRQSIRRWRDRAIGTAIIGAGGLLFTVAIPDRFITEWLAFWSSLAAVGVLVFLLSPLAVLLGPPQPAREAEAIDDGPVLEKEGW